MSGKKNILGTYFFFTLIGVSFFLSLGFLVSSLLFPANFSNQNRKQRLSQTFSLPENTQPPQLHLKLPPKDKNFIFSQKIKKGSGFKPIHSLEIQGQEKKKMPLPPEISILGISPNLFFFKNLEKENFDLYYEENNYFVNLKLVFFSKEYYDSPWISLADKQLAMDGISSTKKGQKLLKNLVRSTQKEIASLAVNYIENTPENSSFFGKIFQEKKDINLRKNIIVKLGENAKFTYYYPIVFQQIRNDQERMALAKALILANPKQKKKWLKKLLFSFRQDSLKEKVKALNFQEKRK